MHGPYPPTILGNRPSVPPKSPPVDTPIMSRLSQCTFTCVGFRKGYTRGLGLHCTFQGSYVALRKDCNTENGPIRVGDKLKLLIWRYFIISTGTLIVKK